MCRLHSRKCFRTCEFRRSDTMSRIRSGSPRIMFFAAQSVKAGGAGEVLHAEELDEN